MVAAATAGAVLTGLLGVAGASGSSAAPVLASAAPPGTSSDAVALLADLGVAVGQGTTIQDGSVVVRESTNGPYLTSTQAEAVLGRDVVVGGVGVGVVADTVLSRMGSRLESVTTNEPTLRGEVRGSTTTPLTLPVEVPAPVAPEISAGADEVVVPESETQTLDAGSYGPLVAEAGATVVLTGGNYAFASLAFADGVVLDAADDTHVVVAGRATIGADSDLGPAPVEAGLPEPSLRLTVLGTNLETEQPIEGAALDVRPRTHLAAALHVPEGTARLRHGAQLEGSVAARWIRVGADALIRYVDRVPEDVPLAVSLVTPLPDAVVGGEVQLTAAVDGASGAHEVTFQVDGEPVASATAPAYTATWDSTTVADGDHEVVAVVADGAGTASTAPANVTVLQSVVADRLLEKDLADGLLTPEEHALIAVHRWTDPDSVPERYRTDATEGADLTIPLAAGLRNLRTLDPAVRQQIVDELAPPGTDIDAPPLSADDVYAALDQYIEEPGETVPGDQAPLPGDETPVPGDEEETPDPPTEEEAPSPPTATAAAATVPEPEASPSAVPTSSAAPDPDAQAEAGTEPSVTETPAPEARTGPIPFPEPPDPPVVKRRGTVVCLAEGESWHIDEAQRDLTLPCRYRTLLADFWYLPEDSLSDDTAIDMTDVLDATLDHADDAPERANGVPDVIDATVESFYQATLTYVNLGYATIGRPQVAVSEFAAGLSLPVVGTVFIDEESPVYLARHELFHQYQYEYTDLLALGLDYSGAGSTSTGWWLEATAEWASHHAQDDAWGVPASSQYFGDAYLAYSGQLEDHLGSPRRPLTEFVAPHLSKGRQPHYGAFLFAEYLEQEHGADIIREVWEGTGITRTPVEVLAELLQDSYGTTLADVTAGYHRANYTIADSYSSWDAESWEQRLDGQRPPRVEEQVSAGGRYPAVGSDLTTLYPGGALYVELDLADYGPDGVSVDIDVEALGAGRSSDDLRGQIEYVNQYPETCYPGDNREMVNTTGAAALTEVTLSPTCPRATVIISHTDPAFGGLALGGPHAAAGDAALTVRWTATARDLTYATQVEHRNDVVHHRVNAGEDLDRWIDTGYWAVTAFDIGSAVSDGRHNFSLNLYSIDRGRASSATIIVNGTELELDHIRYPAPSDGRYRTWGRQPAWYSSDLSTFILPDELLVDGTNIIQIQARGSLLIHGAYLESNAYYPEPDPDPDPCSDCPVAS